MSMAPRTTATPRRTALASAPPGPPPRDALRGPSVVALLVACPGSARELGVVALLDRVDGRLEAALVDADHGEHAEERRVDVRVGELAGAREVLLDIGLGRRG